MEIFNKIGEAELKIKDKTIKLPLHEGSEHELGIDISKLRQETGAITLDPGYGNTGACTSAITYIDGDKGILRHRGIPIEDLAEKSTFLETSYLLIYGKLPNRKEIDEFTKNITYHSLIHEDMKRFFNGYPV